MTDSTIDRDRIERAVRELLVAIGDDPDRAGLEKTPERVATAWADFFSGVGVDPLTHLAVTDEFADDHDVGELVLMRNIAVRSMCEHHLLPVHGTAHVAYVPRDRIVGLGAIPRVVETLASRPQLQERLTEQIADAIETGLDARGVLVMMEAEHGCVSSRGVRQTEALTMTIAARGELAETAGRSAVFALMGREEKS